MPRTGPPEVETTAPPALSSCLPDPALAGPAKARSDPAEAKTASMAAARGRANMVDMGEPFSRGGGPASCRPPWTEPRDVGELRARLPRLFPRCAPGGNAVCRRPDRSTDLAVYRVSVGALTSES